MNFIVLYTYKQYIDISDSDYLKDGEAVYGYDLIDGERTNIKWKLGPGFWGDLDFDLSPSQPNKISLGLTGGLSGDILEDNRIIIPITSGIISQVGANVVCSQVLVNNDGVIFKPSFSNWPCSIGDTLTITGIGNVMDIQTLNIVLQ